MMSSLRFEVWLMRTNFAELETALTPYLNILEQSVSFGWNEWSRKYNTDRLILSRSARAIIVRDHIVYKALELIAQKPNLRWIKYKCRFFVVVNERVLVQFKKLDGQRRTRNYKTPQSEKISLQIPLDDMPAQAEYVQVGYVLDVAQTSVNEICVTYQVGPRVLWFLQLAATKAPVDQPTAGAGYQPSAGHNIRKAKEGKKVTN